MIGQYNMISVEDVKKKHEIFMKDVKWMFEYALSPLSHEVYLACDKMKEESEASVRWDDEAGVMITTPLWDAIETVQDYIYRDEYWLWNSIAFWTPEFNILDKKHLRPNSMTIPMMKAYFKVYTEGNYTPVPDPPYGPGYIVEDFLRDHHEYVTDFGDLERNDIYFYEYDTPDENGRIL
jgi:hypothetical protein